MDSYHARLKCLSLRRRRFDPRSGKFEHLHRLVRQNILLTKPSIAFPTIMMYVGTSADIKVKRKYHSEDQGSKTKTKPVGNVLLA